MSGDCEPLDSVFNFFFDFGWLLKLLEMLFHARSDLIQTGRIERIKDEHLLFVETKAEHRAGCFEDLKAPIDQLRILCLTEEFVNLGLLCSRESLKRFGLQVVKDDLDTCLTDTAKDLKGCFLQLWFGV